jgi:hypothetical protein
MINASLVGRNLHLHLDGIDEDFVIQPLGGRDGRKLTEQFLLIATGRLPAEGMQAILETAVGAETFERIQVEASAHEGEDLTQAAFYWQTVLGMDGVNAYISGGEGMAGSKKALQLLALTLGISPTQTAPSGALESLIQSQAPTPPTDRPTTTLDKLPASKPRANRKPRSSKPPASQP